MKRVVFSIALAVTLMQAHAQTDWSHIWSRLWRNADQRGEALLKSGDAAGAAKEYADAQRKGYAALKAGDFAGAAQSLSTVDSTEAHYNRGNALAYGGDLQGALKAYDAALKHNPKHLDARHNRDVVTKALQEQQQTKDANDPNQAKRDQPSDNQAPKSDESKTLQQDKAKDGQPDKKGDEKNDKQGSAQGAAQDSKANSNEGSKSASKQGTSQSSSLEGKPDKQADSAQGQGPSGKAGNPSQHEPKANPAGLDDASQARRELAASSDGKKPGQSGNLNGVAADDGRADLRNANGLVTNPLTEKQIAQEQWLRSIPDDPGGLLRRKFLIEHMLREQGKRP